MKNFSFPVLLATVLLFSCQGKKPAAQGRQRVALPVVEVPLKTVTGYSVYPVSIEGTSNSAVRAKVSGYITAVLVDEGQRVNKGQTLFKLETQSLTQDAGAAQANVNAAE